jgi:hypothetical protein
MQLCRICTVFVPIRHNSFLGKFSQNGGYEFRRTGGRMQETKGGAAGGRTTESRAEPKANSTVIIGPWPVRISSGCSRS